MDLTETVRTAAAVVLVEGISDRIALETAAVRQGRDLAAERVVILPIGGAHAITRSLAELGPVAGRVRLAGMCDLREERIFRRDFFLTVCVNDLEEELIRAAGPAAIEALFAAEGDLRLFHLFQSQPAWRGRDLEAQIYRFVRSSSRRNLRYARLLVETAATLPRPLDDLLAWAGGPVT
ncbi:TOPRIM nucleotidyl transferase/hydrolase domain-containing protein [Actinoplanes sp. NPDC024001]|uniref:TOPRIM nucleotidyl transferase/hydrolase domain-containing protein n=1 Tax=Actinoplanes sp. NPDC024001 TaxID=3154598 RepID=UPI0034062919